MALSVSGFPEPSRHTEVFTGEVGQDGFSKSTLSPRLRGLFGASSNTGPNKKPESKQPTSKPDESDVPGTATTPPTTPGLSFATSSFEPLSQEEYELELQLLPLNGHHDPSRSASSSKRAQLPPLPRRTTPSPVRLTPSLTRLDIGPWSRAPTTLHSHSKPLPPSVVVEEWSTKVGDMATTAQQPRPLPSLPGFTKESAKSTSNAVASSSKLPNAPAPVAGSSKHVNAVAGSSKHVNAVAGPSKHPTALASPTVSPTPASKVLITQKTVQRTHKQNSPSLSMRYQPLVADPPAASADPASKDVDVSSPVRPLPRIPPAASRTTALACPSRLAPPPPKGRPRRKTITGFVPPGGNSSNNCTVDTRFDNVLGSWASKPVDINSQHRPISPPLPISSASKSPRSRSYSRPRRDRSLDSHYSKTTTPPLRIPSKTGSNNDNNTTAPRIPSRSSPSPTVFATRPLPRKAATTDQIDPPTKALRIQTSSIARGNTQVLTTPVGKRPTPPIGPVKPRTKSSPVTSPDGPAAAPIAPSLPLQPFPSPPKTRPPSPEQEKTEKHPIPEEMQSNLEAPLHSHPVDAFTDSESLLQPSVSPTPNPESPVEVFVDDQDLSTLSRSPSPIRYARPDSRGNLSDDSELEELNFASCSSTSSSREASPNRRRRTQLRSYRKSYRPHAERASPPLIPYRTRSPSPAIPEQHPEPRGHSKTKKKKQEKYTRKGARSYFGDGKALAGGAGSGSAPATRASSPERKSRSRQPRKLAEAVSLALEEVRNRGRGASSISPRRKGKTTPTAPVVSSTLTPPPPPPDETDEVLDISLPPPASTSVDAAGATDTGSSSVSMSDVVSGSARSSTKAVAAAVATGWAKTMARSRKRSDNSSSASGSVAHLSTTIEVDGAEMAPHPWASTSKPPAPGFIPPVSAQHHHHHRRNDSLSLALEDPLLPNRHPQPESPDGSDRFGLACGLPIGSGKSRPVDSVSVSRPPPSNATSTPFSFGITSRKKKITASIVANDDPYVVHIERDSSTTNALGKDQHHHHRHHHDAVAWLSSGSDRSPEGDVMVVTTTRRIMRNGVDDDGDLWEHEQETGVAEVIPHLRTLKASKS